jgi:outer membrane protein TolC
VSKQQDLESVAGSTPPSSRISSQRAGLVALCGLCLSILAGCSAGPDFVRPDAPAGVTHYNHGGDPRQTVAVEGVSQRFESGTEPVANWWRLFNSKQLDFAVSQGLADNPGLQAAESSLRVSQDNLRAGSGIFYPQLSASFGESREKGSTATPLSTFSGGIFNLTTLTASVNYALDVFGAQRRMVEGLGAQADQQLVGKTPAEWHTQEVLLADIALPQNLPHSLPSELVRQRPDILVAEAQLHQASAGIGVTTAAMFPSVTLNADYGRSSRQMNNLFDGRSSVWGVGADVNLPLFNGGTLSARRRGAIDAYQQSFSLYRQTVLSAFAQVADIVRALEHDAEVSQFQARSVDDAELSLNLLRKNYQSGLVNYLQVLNAEILYHQTRVNDLQAKAQHLQDTTALFVALGGGWTHDAKAREYVDLKGTIGK